MKLLYKTTIVLSILIFPMLAQAVNIKEGKWNWTMTVDMSGMQIRPLTYDLCVSKKNLLPQVQNNPNKCKIVKSTTTNDTFKWEIHCNSQTGTTVSKGRVRYTGTSAAGKVLVINKGMNIKSSLSGVYVSACK